MSIWKGFAVFGVLILTAFLAFFLKQNIQVTVNQQVPDFEKIFPNSFGEWGLVENNLPDIVDPQMQGTIDKIYTQTVNKIYKNSDNKLIMLSLAYGPVQSDQLQVHKPEICYPAQGFEVVSSRTDWLKVAGRSIPVRQLETVNGTRKEFVTYWIRMGDKIVKNRFDRKLQQLIYRFQGKVSDGLLFRISSISQNQSSEFELQEEFVNALLSGLEADNQKLLIGTD